MIVLNLRYYLITLKICSVVNKEHILIKILIILFKLNDIKGAQWVDILDKPIGKQEIVDTVKTRKNKQVREEL